MAHAKKLMYQLGYEIGTKLSRLISSFAPTETFSQQIESSASETPVAKWSSKTGMVPMTLTKETKHAERRRKVRSQHEADSPVANFWGAALREHALACDEDGNATHAAAGWHYCKEPECKDRQNEFDRLFL